MVSHSLRALWDEPRPARAPTRVWRDWALLGVVLTATILEVLLRAERSGIAAAVAVSAVIAGTLLWRRTRPLTAVLVAFGALIAFDVARIVALDATGLYGVAAALVLPYALLRWGSGREVVLGLPVVLLWLTVTPIADVAATDEVLAGFGFFLFSAALGASVRLQANNRRRDIEQAQLRERNELARELHDTVGHHVSAIAIQAQAGRALAASHPDRALAVLETIEGEASRTLAEMRAMVGALREDGAAELAPRPALADLEGLARDVGASPRVDVRLSGALDELTPAVTGALHRIAQEAVTNATRHARGATCVRVEVVGDDDRVRLTVHDDGDAATVGPPGPGYGLLGMAERAALLGGEVQAGPAADGGWRVAAWVPKAVPTTARRHAAPRTS